MTTNEYNLCVDQFADRLFRFLLKNTGSEDLARDLVQDCFEKLWMKKENVDFERSKSYLFTMAHNAMIDQWRKDKGHQDIAEYEEQVGYEQNQYSGLRPIIERALAKLPEVQRSVLLLRDYEGYDYAEIGRICELNESQVKVYIYRARVAMKNYLGSLNLVL